MTPRNSVFKSVEIVPIVMEGKRPSDTHHEAVDTKRAKMMMKYEVRLREEQTQQDHVYIDLALLFETPLVSKYFKRHYTNVTHLIQQEPDLVVFNVKKEDVAQGLFKAKTSSYSNKLDRRLVRLDGKIQELLDKASNAVDMSAPLAPSVIDNIGFFEDALGEKHLVEMRGERTVNGIYFKVKDVGKLIDTAKLVENVRLDHTRAQEGDDYVWFLVLEDDQKTPKRELFFTFIGLLRALMRSKMPGAVRLCVWVCNVVFVHSFGTVAQKVTLGRSLLTKQTIDEVTKRTATNIACVYLVETTKTTPVQVNGIMKKVYKFGYSKKMQERMSKLVRKHGHDSVLDTLIFLPEDHLSTAEKKLKHILGTKYHHQDGTATELLLLSEAERKTVQSAMRTVGESFYGSTVVHLHQVELLEQRHQHALEMVSISHQVAIEKMNVAMEKTHGELMAAKKDIEIAKKETEVVTKDVTILTMQLAAQAQRIKELEEQLERHNRK